MAKIRVISEITPAGDFPVAAAHNISLEEKRLDEALSGMATESNLKITALENKKVDKIEGKGLSANDYSDIEKAKVIYATEEIAKFNGYFTLV